MSLIRSLQLLKDNPMTQIAAGPEQLRLDVASGSSLLIFRKAQ